MLQSFLQLGHVLSQGTIRPPTQLPTTTPAHIGSDGRVVAFPEGIGDVLGVLQVKSVGQPPPVADRGVKVIVSNRDLDAHVVRTSIVVLLNPTQRGVNTTARDDPIDKPIRGVIDVSLSESTPQQVVGVVGQLEIVSHPRSGHAPSPVQIRVDDHHLLRSQKGTLTEMSRAVAVSSGGAKQ